MSAGLTAFTIFHVALSLVGIGSGFVVFYGMLTSKRLDLWTAVFLSTTALTSLTGFLFPIEKITPGIIVGIVSLVVLAVAFVARYVRHMAGIWRAVYVVFAAMALYLNFFVLVVQLFQKAPALKELAPTQSEPPFQMTQLVVLVLFVVLTVVAAIRFRVEPVRANT